MIGIDLTSIKRFENRERKFIEKILTNKEIEEYQLSENKAHFLATRWAIKEAIFKADNSYYEFNKIEVLYIDRKYKCENFEISTSSENEQIIAIALKKKGM